MNGKKCPNKNRSDIDQKPKGKRKKLPKFNMEREIGKGFTRKTDLQDSQLGTWHKQWTITEEG